MIRSVVKGIEMFEEFEVVMKNKECLKSNLEKMK